jgi:hypothetical protein
VLLRCRPRGVVHDTTVRSQSVTSPHSPTRSGHREDLDSLLQASECALSKPCLDEMSMRFGAAQAVHMKFLYIDRAAA